MKNYIGKVVKYNEKEFVIMEQYNSNEGNGETVVLAKENPEERDNRYYPFDHTVSLYDVEIIDRKPNLVLPDILQNGTIVKIISIVEEYNDRIGRIVGNDMEDCFPDLSDLNYYIKFIDEKEPINNVDSHDAMVHMSEVEVLYER